jgi:hypothetical protein
MGMIVVVVVVVVVREREWNGDFPIRLVQFISLEIDRTNLRIMQVREIKELSESLLSL